MNFKRKRVLGASCSSRAVGAGPPSRQEVNFEDVGRTAGRGGAAAVCVKIDGPR